MPKTLRVIPVFRGNPLAIDSTAWDRLKQQASDQIVQTARYTIVGLIFVCCLQVHPFISKSGYNEQISMQTERTKKRKCSAALSYYCEARVRSGIRQ